jgi:endonuclease YncB( thermonuclease family)
VAKSKTTKSADPDEIAEELVAVTCLVSEAGYGIRAGEVRGFGKSIAAEMVKRGHAEYYNAKSAPAKAE